MRALPLEKNTEKRKKDDSPGVNQEEHEGHRGVSVVNDGGGGVRRCRNKVRKKKATTGILVYLMNQASQLNSH